MGTLVPIAMWSSYDILVSIDISVTISPIGMNILIFLRDPNYIGEEIFIVCKIGCQMLVPNANHVTMQTYNNMHASFRVQVKWDIGG